MTRTRLVWVSIFFFALLRFAHARILWVEEAYGMAAAAEVLRGRWIYRDIWFDKPPLYAAYYLLSGANEAFPLRLSGFIFVLAAAALIYLLARHLWSETEGLAAAFLLSFFLTFGIPSAVMAAAPDLLMIVPHLAAVYFAASGRAFHSGAAAAIALLTNAKGIFVWAVCLAWRWRSAAIVFLGFSIFSLLALAILNENRAASAHWLQVWHWGWIYSRDSFLADPLREGIARTLNWAGFHSAAVIAAAWCLRKEPSPKLILWLIVSAIAAMAGWRFFPRYYFQILPVVCVCAARGFTLMPGRWRMACAALLLVPFIRFGPRYITLSADLIAGREHNWTDLALYRDSRRIASVLAQHRAPGDSLFVWGYRPDIFVLSKMPAGTPFLDSQPVTGVIADRHLTVSRPTSPEIAEANRIVLQQTRPSFIVDGLGLLNPELAITRFPDLSAWLSQYEVIGRTATGVVYRLSSNPIRRTRLPPWRPQG